MATKIKTITLKIPVTLSDEEGITILENQIENATKEKLNNNWSFVQMISGNGFIFLIFSKEEI